MFVNIFYFGLGFLVVTLGETAAHSVDRMFSCILTICNFSYSRFGFTGRDLGSDCSSSWSLHICYFYNLKPSEIYSRPLQIGASFVVYKDRC